MKAKHIKNIYIFILSILIIGFYGCIKQEINTDDIILEEYSPTVAFSIGNADFKISDITGTRDLETDVVSFLDSIYPEFDYSNYLNNFNTTIFPFVIDSRDVNYALKFPFNGDDFFDLNDSVKQLKFKLHITNGIPVRFNTQVYFLNGNNELVDSLLTFNNQLFEEGITNIESNGTENYHRLVSAEEKAVTINSKEKLSILKTSRSIIVRFTGKQMNQTSNTLIEESNFLKFKIGVLIEDDISDNL